MITEKYTEKHIKYNIQFKVGKIKSKRIQEFLKRSVRVFLDDHRVGIASTIGNIDEKDLKQKAIENANIGFTYNYDLETNVHYEFNRGDHELNNLEYLNQITEEYLKMFEPFNKKFVINGSFESHRIKRSIQNSENLLLHSDRSDYSGGFSLKIIGSPNIIDGFLSFDSFFSIDKDGFMSCAERIMNAILMEESDINFDECEVAFIGLEPLSKLYSDIDGERYILGSSLLSGKLDQQIMREDVCINEVSDDSDACIFVPFDHEGIIRNIDSSIVKNGIFSHIIFDKKRAKKYDHKETGNGFRSFDSHPWTSSVPLIPETTMDSLIQYSYQKPLLVPYMSSGGDFLPNGDFSFPVQLAFILKNGQIIGRAPQITITGNYLSCLNEQLTGIAPNDLFPEIMHQPVIISKLKISLND